jgi:hypothetical protein
MGRTILGYIVLFLLLCCYILNAYSTVIAIGMNTDKQVYNVGDVININGNVTSDGTLVTDALVAIEIRDPNGNPYIVRTIQTGENISEQFKVIILNLYTCDSHGNPNTLLKRGSLAYFNLTLKNVDYLTYHVKAAVYVQCSDNTPLIAFYPFEADVEYGQEVKILESVLIPSNAPLGEARIFANLYSDTPKNGGTPYCPEKTAKFYIGSTTPNAPLLPQYFKITFTLPKTNVKLGKYTVYARSYYKLTLATQILTFEVILLGDINGDGIVNMRDIGAICNLYNTRKGDLNWNPDADLNKDGIINMRDIGLACNSFGNSGVY